MARKFYPRKTKYITASDPHAAGTEYKVSVGDEEWGDGTFQSVVKVQMVYDGKVAGRMSPSYPVESQDWLTILDGIIELTDEKHYMVPAILTKDGILSQMKEIIGLTEDKPSSERMIYLDVHTGYISHRMTGIFMFSFYHLADDLKLLCDFNEEEGLDTCDEMLEIIDGLDSDDYDFTQGLIDVIENIKKIVKERHAQ